MTVRFNFPRYNTKQVEKIIICRISDRGKEINLNTGCKVDPKLWDKAVQRINLRKEKSPIRKNILRSINKILEAYENKINDISYQVRSHDPSASFDKIASAILDHFNKKDRSLFTSYQDFLKVKSSLVTNEALQKYKRVKTLLMEYEKENNEKLNFDKINRQFMDGFFLFLITKKQMLNNTAHKTIQFLKTFIIWAKERGLTNNTTYKSFKSKEEKNEIITLTNDELMTLYDYQTDVERLARVRDLFVFQCFTGVRYSDIERLQSEDIKSGIWKLRTQKTRDIIEIPLNPYALSILAKYSDWERPLPVISNQKINKYVKELCELAGIDETVKIVRYRGNERIESIHKKFQVVGSHTARRTFISLSLEKGMKPDVIMAITGHKTYKMMQKYLSIASEHKKKEMDKAWGDVSLRVVS